MMTESMAKPKAKGTPRASKPRTARVLGDSTTGSKICFVPRRSSGRWRPRRPSLGPFWPCPWKPVRSSPREA